MFGEQGMIRKHKARADGMAVTDEGGKLVYKRDKQVDRKKVRWLNW